MSRASMFAVFLAVIAGASVGLAIDRFRNDYVSYTTSVDLFPAVKPSVFLPRLAEQAAHQIRAQEPGFDALAQGRSIVLRDNRVAKSDLLAQKHRRDAVLQFAHEFVWRTVEGAIEEGTRYASQYPSSPADYRSDRQNKLFLASLEKGSAPLFSPAIDIISPHANPLPSAIIGGLVGAIVAFLILTTMQIGAMSGNAPARIE